MTIANKKMRYDSHQVNMTIKKLLPLVLLLLANCGPSSLPPRATWRGTLVLPQTKVALRMELDLSGPKPSGSFIVGNERTPIPEITRNGNSLTFTFSEYGAEMRAEWDGRELKGNYFRLRSSGTKSFAFSASPDTTMTASSPADPPIGIFEVAFHDQEEGHGITLAKLWKDGEAYYGTFVAPDGDYGLLEGAEGDQGIQLHRFTGWQAIAIELKPNGASWSGRFHAASDDKPRAFTLQPHSGAEPPAPPSKLTSMKNANDPFAFSCTSLSGETVRNADERFNNKALALDIMGTWCHNCMDESPVLQELQTRYAKDGFEVIGLSFEISDDAELGRKNLALYRDRFKLTYPLLYCGSVDDANVDRRLKNQLQNFFAFPTTLFIDKKGKVKAIHSGFHGPGTGDLFPLQIKKLHELAQSAVLQR
jgi:thiol-disulfide isomerase/thioredoxin